MDILPPAGLFCSVLPVHIGQKLTFPLHSCVREEQAKPMLDRTHYCHHSNADRMLRSTWCTPELVQAVASSSKSTKFGIPPSPREASDGAFC